MIMKGIINKVKRVIKCGLCLLALMPLHAYGVFGKYGILEEENDTKITWHEQYVTKTINGELPNRYESFAKGSGTVEDPYLIETVWDLCRLEDWVNNRNNSFLGKNFKLVNDIDLGDNNLEWYPIGIEGANADGTFFAGYFDGNGKTVKNMRITLVDSYPRQKYSYGLFGKVRGAIRNLNMTGAQITISTSESNLSTNLYAGLLCGQLVHDFDADIFGAIYGCHVQGKIEGQFKNEYKDYLDSNIGGIVGFCDNPVSIYKCQADVTMNLTDIYNIGGIVGFNGAVLSVPDDWTNEKIDRGPCVSYIFDCVANVNIKTTLSDASRHECGGICGYSLNNILACATTGTIISSVSASGSAASNSNLDRWMGGLTGMNGSNIMSSVSMVRLQGGTVVGGLVGVNSNKLSDLLVGNVANCIYSGHIDSPNAQEAHGLVGSQHQSSNAPVNCLFVGTMTPGTSKAPLSDGSTSTCYADVNLYDDNDMENQAYLLTSQLTDALPSFTESIQYNNAWYSYRTNAFRYVNLPVRNGWEHHSGFYPQLKINSNNLANGVTAGEGFNYTLLIDYVIERASDAFADDASTIRTPTLVQNYAWLASVPLNVTNNAFTANFVDMPLSLAIKQQEVSSSDLKNAHYSINNDETLITVSGETDAQTATPKDNVVGDVKVTITSDDGISKDLNLHVNTSHKWDGITARNYDSGDGTESTPYLIHNARQLMKAFTSNAADEYYKLTKDIWFNENLLDYTGEPKAGSSQWDHEGKRDENLWKAHLDGNSHLVRGLFTVNAFGLIEAIQSGASIENTGFVDCLTWSPEHEDWNLNEAVHTLPFGFLAPKIATNAVVRNSLFHGAMKERRDHKKEISSTTGNQNVWDHSNYGGLIHTIDDATSPISQPVIEDCVVAVTTKSVITDNGQPEQPDYALLNYHPGAQTGIVARRVLVLNDNGATSLLVPDGWDNYWDPKDKIIGMKVEQCHYPAGYLKKHFKHGGEENSKPVEEMTDGTFFSGDGYGKWTVTKGRFPMLKSFDATEYGKLITLPVFASSDNPLHALNYLIDFTPGRATWQSTEDVLRVDTDIRVVEPNTASSSTFLVRSMDGATMTMPITTASTITTGIEFKDIEAKKFCLAHYDANGDNAISLSELKNVTLDRFQQDMNEDDGNTFDNDGELIEQFPEFRYFAGINNLGTSFHEKDKLQEVGISGKITELNDNAFRGTSSMTAFTLPVTMMSVGAHPFSNSGLKNYAVETDHAAFAAPDGVLMNSDSTQLVSYPNGRDVTSIDIDSKTKKILSNAIYKVPKVDTIYIRTADYDYETVVDLAENGVVHATEGKQVLFYVLDATNDDATNDDAGASSYRAPRRSSETGKGNGHLLYKYINTPCWRDEKIDRCWELEVSEKSKDKNGRYWATLYIGFDTQLPEGLTAYTVDQDATENTLKLHKVANGKVPMMTPVVIMAQKAGKYMLFSSNEEKYDELPMSENKLDGVNRKGLDVYQSDANDGGCLTLGRNSNGEVGFFIYKGKAKIPPFRSYISVNKVSGAKFMLFDINEEGTSSVSAPLPVWSESVGDTYYNLNGQRLEQPVKGINVTKGRLFIKK